MNATEARALSNHNVPKLRDAHFKQAVSHINQEIKHAAKIGRFTASTGIFLPNIIKEDVINQLVVHYRVLGYEVRIFNLLNSKTFSISWEQK